MNSPPSIRSPILQSNAPGSITSGITIITQI
jgi:hypothetical protein